MSCYQRKAVMRRNLNVHFGKATAHVKPAAMQKKTIIGARSFRREWKLAQDRDVNVCIRPGNKLPMREINASIMQRRSQTLQRLQASHFLDGKYTAFGEVTKGIGVADKIVSMPRNDRDLPNERVEMTVTILE